MSIPLQAYLALLRGYLRPQWPRVLALLLLLLASIGLQLYNPQLLRQFIDSATSQGPLRALTTTALIFIGIAFAGQAASVAATFVGETVAWTATNALRIELAAHCLGLDLAFHKERSSGELIERIDGDVDALSNFFSQFVVGVFGNLVLLAGVLALLFAEDWRIGLAMSAFALVTLVVLIRLRAVAVPYWTAVREASAQFFGFLGEHLAGTEDTRANGASPYVLRSFQRRLRAWLPHARRASLAGYSMWICTIGLFTLGYAVAFGLGAALLRANAITLGTVYMIFYYTELLRRPIDQIRTQIQDLQKAGAAIGRLRELQAIQPTLGGGAGPPLPAGPLALQIQSVSFGYSPGGAAGPASPAPVLRNVDFSLQPGQVLGLLGRTGSGKTTLARMILRLYDPGAGAILLGGQPLTDIPLASLRERVGIVTQDVQLFHATLRDNLTLFNPAIADARIVAALAELGLAGWLAALPAGLDTELEGGSSLSAGEAQLLAFARLALADPGLVILDEASSRLDPATEQLIEQAVTRLLAGRTAIIIAHRLATVGRADAVLILEDGAIIEHGPRAALAADPQSHFAGLLRTGMAEVLA